jgi:hypothetical protein
MKPTLLSFFLLFGAACAADLPVRDVVLYKHGVGYFERAGQLRPGETARLEFKASEMNDVLKSLTIEEKNGTKVSAVRYDSSDSLDHKLLDFPFLIEPDKPLTALLDQLKGAQIQFSIVGPKTITGTLLGARLEAASDKQPERQEVTVMEASGVVSTFDLLSVGNLHFAEPELEAQIKAYLADLATSRSEEKRHVYIDSTTDKLRDLVASYVVPTPVWKSSYRLIFAASGEPTLEGWAIVDNTSGEDWTNVRMALVSGRPVSFISNLYEPRYIQRPTAELPEDRAQAPVVYEGGVVGGVAGGPMARPNVRAKAAPAGHAAEGSAGSQFSIAGARSTASDFLAEAPRLQASVASSIAATAQGANLGELFEYSFASPVTVRKNESAMLPFLQQKIGARKLLVYSERGSQNPLNAAELTNSTGKTLDGGPITVFDGGAYGGEALVETVKTGDKRLISYAVDLGTRVTTKLDSGRQIVRELHMKRGVLTARTAAEETKTYTIRNVDAKPKTLVIEHPIRPEYKVLDQKPVETTATAYRFEVKLAPDSTEKYAVKEERVFDNTYEVTNLTPDVLMTYVQNKALSDAGKKELERIVDQKRQIDEADAGIASTASEISELTQDQARIRQNIDSLNRVSGQQEQVQSYARQLAGQETRLAALRDQASQLKKKSAALKSELDRMLETASF